MRYSEHNVLVKEPDIQSLAALVLLTKQLVPRRTGYRDWLKYRRWYMRQYLKTHKKLTCHYCNKSPLKKQSRNGENLATLDHVQPISKGGKQFHSSNIVVACFSCNSRKRDMDVKEFTDPIV